MRILFVVALAGLCAGCTAEPDLSATIDAKVRQEWMRPGQYQEAIPYLETGGHYYNLPGAWGEPPLDRDYILPLLKQLCGQHPYAIVLDDPTTAWAIVIKLPTDVVARRKLDLLMESARAGFPGMILEEWGHEWLSLDFLDEHEAALVAELDLR